MTISTVPFPVTEGVTLHVPHETFSAYWDRLTARIDSGKATDRDRERYVAIILKTVEG